MLGGAERAHASPAWPLLRERLLRNRSAEKGSICVARYRCVPHGIVAHVRHGHHYRHHRRRSARARARAARESAAAAATATERRRRWR
ncbi:unnamed protein product [Ectocarpus fasciculatus]